jgi:hypothetical protein
MPTLLGVFSIVSVSSVDEPELYVVITASLAPAGA